MAIVIHTKNAAVSSKFIVSVTDVQAYKYLGTDLYTLNFTVIDGKSIQCKSDKRQEMVKLREQIIEGMEANV